MLSFSLAGGLRSHCLVGTSLVMALLLLSTSVIGGELKVSAGRSHAAAEEETESAATPQ